MRVVIDTGVFISAAIKTQTMPNIAVYRATRRGVLLKSRWTEAELVEVIGRPHLARLIAPAARARLVELMALAELVPCRTFMATTRWTVSYRRAGNSTRRRPSPGPSPGSAGEGAALLPLPRLRERAGVRVGGTEPQLR